ncbi:MAG: hypothetical protein WA900_16645, partial [Casimicrobiaceae bacterium]
HVACPPALLRGGRGQVCCRERIRGRARRRRDGEWGGADKAADEGDDQYSPVRPGPTTALQPTAETTIQRHRESRFAFTAPEGRPSMVIRLRICSVISIKQCRSDRRAASDPSLSVRRSLTGVNAGTGRAD